jgi:hypothetical protein
MLLLLYADIYVLPTPFHIIFMLLKYKLFLFQKLEKFVLNKK